MSVGLSLNCLSNVNAKTLRLGSTIARLKLKGIDGEFFSVVEHVVQCVSTRQILPVLAIELIETFICLRIDALLLKTSINFNKSTKIYYSKSVAAWPSSVRALKRMVNSQNGRNPYCLFIVFSISRGTIITGYDAKSVMK